jgi:uncharacterized membrane protein
MSGASAEGRDVAEAWVRKVEARVTILRRVEDVFAYVIAVQSMPEWRGDVAEAVQLTDGPFGVGTRIRAGARWFGRPLGIVVEVTELEPDAKFGYRPVAGPLRTHNVCTFHSEAGSTRVTLTDEIELGGIVGILEPVMARLVRRQYAANLGRLKTLLEAQPASGT